MITNWKVDPGHSELFFKVKHLMISEISGQINSFELNITTEGNDFGQVNDVLFAADLSSLSTNNKQRDKHLKSPDFFDVENHQHLTFNGTKFDKVGMEPQTVLSAFRKDYKLQGNLTIKKITKLITLNGEFGGTAIDSLGQKKAGFSIRGKISQKDFDMTLDEITETGNIILADDVYIFGSLQLIKQN